MNFESEMSVGEVEVMADPETFWIFNAEVKESLMQHFGEKFPIVKEMLLQLELETDVTILRRIAGNAVSPELINSIDAAINLLLSTIGQPPEITRKIKKKFNKLITGRLFIALINDVALKTETEVEFLISMPSINLEDKCVSV